MMVKKPKGGEKISPSTSNVPSRKSPRGLTPKPMAQGEDEYNENEEEMESKDEMKGEGCFNPTR